MWELYCATFEGQKAILEIFYSKIGAVDTRQTVTLTVSLFLLCFVANIWLNTIATVKSREYQNSKIGQRSFSPPSSVAFKSQTLSSVEYNKTPARIRKHMNLKLLSRSVLILATSSGLLVQ